MNDFLPELLSPAGSRAALEAAVEGGADAVYFGGTSFNARMNADNFDSAVMRESVATAHAHGVKCYVTLNTLVTDRELDACVGAAYDAAVCGVDALIVADTGAASTIKRRIPGLMLHASTQASGHNIAASAELQKLGFSRMVMAREASLDDIRAFTAASPLELEVFVHGALCVCHSGQCLFSSLVGGRSGNRGECAQPCRLPYTKSGKEFYPLSLKDLCLAAYIPELIGARVASLKIEGRMKPPEYVLAVTRIWRRLLDERRAATPDEIRELAAIFSRGGFTDGYFTKTVGHQMLGVRSERDKEQTRNLPPFNGLTKKAPLDIEAEMKLGAPAKLTLTAKDATVTVFGDEPQTALTAPMSAADIEKNLTKLGATPYCAGSVKIISDDGIMMPVSKLNALRRSATEQLVGSLIPEIAPLGTAAVPCPVGQRRDTRTARFASADRIPDAARNYFDIIYLPLDRYNGETDGVIMPPVIFERETEKVQRLLESAKALGAKHILVGNVGHIALARESGLRIHGDFRLNVTNSASVAALETLGVNDIIASPELTMPQLRDLKGDVQAIVYGRIPLMLLEKCVICEASSCRGMNDAKYLCSAVLTDRKGVKFPVLREGEHRNIIYNSLPTSMCDRPDELVRYNVRGKHFIFSDETAVETERVIAAFENGEPLPCRVRRI